MKGTPEERFRRFAINDPGTKCWNWAGEKTKDRIKKGIHYLSYGRFFYNNKKIFAHRFSWSFFNNKEIPDGMMICHKCDNTLCVNPNHLFLGTALDNSMDCNKKDRHSRGVRNSVAKITDDIVRQIRVLRIPFKRGFSGKDLGKRFGISATVINEICRGMRWKHVK